LITTTEPVVAPLEKPTIVRKKFNFNYRKSLFVPMVVILVVLISLLSPVMSFAYQVWSIKRNIERLQVVVSAKEIDSVHEQIEALNHHANGLQDLINNYYQPLVFLFSSEKVNNLVQLNQLLQYLTQTGKALSEAATVGSEAFSLISGQKKGDVEHTLHLTETKITEAYHYLSLAQSLIT